jgi:hypothetical protein
MVVLIVLIAVFAPVLAPHDPLTQSTINRLQGPSEGYILGRDGDDDDDENHDQTDDRRPIAGEAAPGALPLRDERRRLRRGESRCGIRGRADHQPYLTRGST